MAAYSRNKCLTTNYWLYTTVILGEKLLNTFNQLFLLKKYSGMKFAKHTFAIKLIIKKN
jgi:hypothetical protein